MKKVISILLKFQIVAQYQLRRTETVINMKQNFLVQFHYRIKSRNSSDFNCLNYFEVLLYC